MEPSPRERIARAIALTAVVWGCAERTPRARRAYYALMRRMQRLGARYGVRQRHVARACDELEDEHFADGVRTARLAWVVVARAILASCVVAKPFRNALASITAASRRLIASMERDEPTSAVARSECFDPSGTTSDLLLVKARARRAHEASWKQPGLVGV
jgi:hypothetical protein